MSFKLKIIDNLKYHFYRLISNFTFKSDWVSDRLTLF